MCCFHYVSFYVYFWFSYLVLYIRHRSHVPEHTFCFIVSYCPFAALVIYLVVLYSFLLQFFISGHRWSYCNLLCPIVYYSKISVSLWRCKHFVFSISVPFLRSQVVELTSCLTALVADTVGGIFEAWPVHWVLALDWLNQSEQSKMWSEVWPQSGTSLSRRLQGNIKPLGGPICFLYTACNHKIVLYIVMNWF